MIQWVVLEVSRVKVQYKHNQLDMDKDNEKDFVYFECYRVLFNHYLIYTSFNHDRDTL